MYIYQKKTKIGRVTIEQHGGGYRLRFTYPKKHRHEIKISNVTDESYLIALKRARQINSDIDNDCFDFDYIKYKPELAKTINVISKKAVEVKPQPKPKITAVCI